MGSVVSIYGGATLVSHALQNHQKMAGLGKLFPLQTLASLTKIVLRRLGNPLSIQTHLQSRVNSNNVHCSALQKDPPVKDSKVSTQTLVFNFEDALLKSGSFFPYFMLVAFEAGGIFRALILLLLYPLVCSVGKELGLKIMVFISFVGIRKRRFQVATSVLPKFFLEDIGCEGFDVVMSCERKIGVSELPSVMVEGFLKEYMGVEAVVGKELKVFHGYFTGLMEDKDKSWATLNELLLKNQDTISYGCFNKSLLRKLSSHCKDDYKVKKAEKRNWKLLPRERYPKPLIFHDGRLAFTPTPTATFAMFMWLPFGLFLSIFRIFIGVSLPLPVANTIHAFIGAQLTTNKHNPFFVSSENKGKPKNVLYVCNHRTLLDPIYISVSIMKPVTAVTYSMSKFNEVIAPIKTIRLTRQRESDRKVMETMLSPGDLVICPEGTTCREPYLLRFSPLFAELTDDLVPVAMRVEASMFYGSTASGLKCLDPLFHYMNPRPKYTVRFLEKLTDFKASSNIEVSNHVQDVIAKVLGFECTNLTRKDKYMALAGNSGI